MAMVAGENRPGERDPEAARADVQETAHKQEERPGRRFSSSRVISAAERDRMIKDARNIDFPMGLRGYDRAAVDRYVEHVNRLLAELEMSSSPESAVRHALDEVSEETRDILQRAHQTAEEITARSRARADDRLQQAEREGQEVRAAAHHEAEETRESAQREAAQLREVAARETQDLRESAQREVTELRESTMSEVTELRETTMAEMTELRETTLREVAELRDSAARESQQVRAAAQREADELRRTARREADELLEAAEGRARELALSAEAIWRERRRLIEDMRAVGDQLVAIGEVESKRFPRLGDEVTTAAQAVPAQVNQQPAPVETPAPAEHNGEPALASQD
jgi:DivIVA domain-containing protein